MSPIYIDGDIMNYFIVAYGAEVSGRRNIAASKLLKHFPSLEFEGNFLIYRATYSDEKSLMVDIDISPSKFIEQLKKHFSVEPTRKSSTKKICVADPCELCGECQTPIIHGSCGGCVGDPCEFCGERSKCKCLCPRCSEPYVDENGTKIAGEKKMSSCRDCFVCITCEHLKDCQHAVECERCNSEPLMRFKDISASTLLCEDCLSEFVAYEDGEDV